ncbi:MAG: cysteine synthase family protein, partial [Sphaerochaetaceae bacterium]
GSFICSQFSNKNNPLAHYSTTGPEIWEAMDGDVDVFIAGVGTGGTISGVGKFLKEKNPNIKIIAVEPKKSPVLSGKKAGPHNLQGIGANFVPDNFDRSVVDEIMQIDEESSYKGMRDLSQYEGILAGITSGSALAAALKVSARSEYKNKNIVIMFPDTGSRYLSTGLFEE